MLGRTLRNHYQIIKFLGQGAFGHTYLAKDLDLPGHPHCVVKHLQPKDPNPAILPIAKRLFDTQAQTLYKLSKLNDQIPSLFAHFEENGEFYFVQDFIEGHDFKKELIPGRKLAAFTLISTNTTLLFFPFPLSPLVTRFIFGIPGCTPDKETGFFTLSVEYSKGLSSKNRVSGHLCVSPVWENHCHCVNAFIQLYKIELMQRPYALTTVA